MPTVQSMASKRARNKAFFDAIFIWIINRKGEGFDFAKRY